jgi:hypothetical protein
LGRPQVNLGFCPDIRAEAESFFFVTLKAESETDRRHGCVRSRIGGEAAKSEVGCAIHETSVFHAKCDGFRESIVRSCPVQESAFGLGTGSGEGIELIPVRNEKECSTANKHVRTQSRVRARRKFQDYAASELVNAGLNAKSIGGEHVLLRVRAIAVGRFDREPSIQMIAIGSQKAAAFRCAIRRRIAANALREQARSLDTDF